MRQNPFMFESDELEAASQFEDSFGLFENEYADEFDEYEYGDPEYENEMRRGRSRRYPVQRRQRQQQQRPRQKARPRPRFPKRPRPPRPPRPRYPPPPYPLPYSSPGSLFSTFVEPVQPSSEMVRLLQSLLNKALGLNLPVDGVMNIETRSAIRSFQNPQSAPSQANGGDSATEPAPGGSPPAGDDKDQPQEEFEFEFYNPGVSYFEFEDEYYDPELFEAESSKPASPFRYVKSFASSDAECADAFKRAKKTRAQALTIINTQIGQAIRMLRAAANKLKRGNRSAQTKAIFRKIFRVSPEFVPTWLKPTATIKDRGDVVATRCRRVADLLERGGLRYFCTISKKNCPDCSDPVPGEGQPYACSSWGSESAAPKNSRVVCLGTDFWDAMGKKPVDVPSLLAVLMHEPFHIFYGKYVTGHERIVNGKPVSIGKFGGIYCITQFVFEANGRTSFPKWMKNVCDNTQVRN